MTKSSFFLLFVLLSSLLFAQQRPAQRPAVTKPAPAVTSPVTVYGSVFADYLYVFQEPQTLNPASGTDGRNEFAVRRAMLGVDYAFSPAVTSKIEYDAGGGLGLMQAFVNVHNLMNGMDLRLGRMIGPSTETVQKFWEYRALGAGVLERTPGMLHEYDNGILFTARTDAAGSAYARLGIFNGTGPIAETDKVKKYAMTVGNWFDRGSMAELYVDFENVGAGRSTITGKLFYGMRTQSSMLGIEAFYRMNRKFAGTNDVTPLGGSLFGWFEMMPAMRAVLRADFVDNDLNSSNAGSRDLYFNAGLDYMPAAHVHLMPNVVYTKALKKGSTVVGVDFMAVQLTLSTSLPAMK